MPNKHNESRRHNNYNRSFGLIRQFFADKMRFEKITKIDVLAAIDNHVHLPRMCLGFKTPHEVILERPQ